MRPEEFLCLLLLYIIGTVVSMVITGILADRLVIRRVMRNEEVQDFMKLFREGKEYLKEILENQKKKDT